MSPTNKKFKDLDVKAVERLAKKNAERAKRELENEENKRYTRMNEKQKEKTRRNEDIDAENATKLFNEMKKREF